MPTETTVERTSQRRAKFALEYLGRVPQSLQKKFSEKVKGAPAMILQNGLGAALAFMLHKDKNDHKEVTKAVLAWLAQEGILPSTNTNPVPGDLIRGINKLDVSDYLRAQREALEVLAWLKRYADAELFGER